MSDQIDIRREVIRLAARLYAAAIPANMGETARQLYLRSPLYIRARAYTRVIDSLWPGLADAERRAETSKPEE